MSNKYFRRVEADLQNKKLLENADEFHEERVEETTTRINKFAFLNEDEKTSSSEHNSDSDQNKKTKNSNIIKKSKKKKKKVINNRSANDEIDIFLNSQNELKSSATSSFLLTCEALMRIDARNLRADNELRKLLGKSFGRVMNEAQQGNSLNNRFHRNVCGRLVKPGLNWPPLTQIGISMTIDKEKNGIKWYKFEHNQNYRNFQQSFWIFQNNLDYESNEVLVKSPYHLDSLLLLAEYLRVHEDAQSSREALEKGLFACENALHSSFQLFSLNSRLSYEWRENRAFFLLIHYYILSLIQRNCFGTALEYAKLIFIKDPDYDPLSILLIIDSLALKAKNYKFLIEFYENYKEEKKLDLLPNFVYSVALAHYLLGSLSNSSINESEELTKAEKCFEFAISRFPFLLGQILDKLQIKADSSVENCYPLSTLAFYKETEGLRLLSEIYLHHSHELWKLPNILLWLETTTHKILPKISSKTSDGLKTEINEWTKKRKTIFVGIPDNIKRHSVIHSIKLNEGGANSTLVDPCPPSKTLSSYSPINFYETSHSTTSRQFNFEGLSTNTLLELARSLLPDDFQSQLDSVGGNLRNYTSDFITRVVDQLSFLSENPLTNEENNIINSTAEVENIDNNVETENSLTNELNTQTINEESSSPNNLSSTEASPEYDGFERQ